MSPAHAVRLVHHSTICGATMGLSYYILWISEDLRKARPPIRTLRSLASLLVLAKNMPCLASSLV